MQKDFESDFEWLPNNEGISEEILGADVDNDDAKVLILLEIAYQLKRNNDLIEYGQERGN